MLASTASSLVPPRARNLLELHEAWASCLPGASSVTEEAAIWKLATYTSAGKLAHASYRGSETPLSVNTIHACIYDTKHGDCS